MAVDYKKVLLGLGFKAEQLPKDDEETPDYEKISSELSGHLRTSLENDSSFVNKFKDQAYGRATGEIQRKLVKKFKLTFDNPEDEKDIDKVIDSAQKAASQNANKTAQELQAQLGEKDKEIEDIKKSHGTVLENTRGEIIKIKRGMKFDELIANELTALNDPAKKIKLASPVKVNIPFFRSELEANYHIDYDDKTDKFAPKQKDHPELFVKDGTKVLGFSDLIRQTAEKNNLLITVEEKKKGFKFTPDVNGEGREEVAATSEGLRKIQEKASLLL